MTRRIRSLVRLVAATSLLTLGAIAAPAVSAGDPCFHGYVMPPATTGPGTDIKLMPCSFEPTVTTIAVGQEVTFYNGEDYTHLITGANQTWGSRDVEVQPNETVTYTFDAPGVYPYACALHVGMSGAIVVGDPDDALAAGPTTGSGTGEDPGGLTGASAQSATEANPEAIETVASATGESGLPSSLVFAAIGVAGGLVAGASAVWLAIRRRSPADQRLVHAE